MKCNKNTKARLLRGVLHSVFVAGAIICLGISNQYLLRGGISLIFFVLSIGFAMTELVFTDAIRKMDGKPTIVGMVIGSTKLDEDNVETCVSEVRLDDGNVIYFDAYVIDTND